MPFQNEFYSTYIHTDTYTIHACNATGCVQTCLSMILYHSFIFYRESGSNENKDVPTQLYNRCMGSVQGIHLWVLQHIIVSHVLIKPFSILHVSLQLHVHLTNIYSKKLILLSHESITSQYLLNSALHIVPIKFNN